jgi:hypothetical protein
MAVCKEQKASAAGLDAVIFECSNIRQYEPDVSPTHCLTSSTEPDYHAEYSKRQLGNFLHGSFLSMSYDYDPKLPHLLSHLPYTWAYFLDYHMYTLSIENSAQKLAPILKSLVHQKGTALKLNQCEIYLCGPALNLRIRYMLGNRRSRPGRELNRLRRVSECVGLSS